MRAIRILSVATLKSRTVKSWADEIMNYLTSMPANNSHVIFDNYSYECSVQTERCHSDGESH